MIRASSTIACLSLATGVAAGQLIDLDASPSTIGPGESTVITMSAGFDSADFAMAGIATELVINAAEGEFSDLRLIAPMDGPGTSEGVLAGSAIEGIIAGQLNFPPAGIYADPTNPIAFWQVTFTASVPTGGLILDIETRTSRFDVYTAMGSATSESRLADLSEGRAVIFPSPGTAGLLGVGGLLACRRRR
ncbi:MAG: hypothetical protein AAFX79_07765 [Planctomycetota bacterium]